MRRIIFTRSAIAMLGAGGLLAGCGTSSHKASAPSPAAVAPQRTDPVSVQFLAPAPGATVGSKVVARVRLSGHGLVQFVLDHGSPRMARGLTITLLHVSPGHHRLTAEVLVSPGAPPEATSAVSFAVRHPPAKASNVVPSPATVTQSTSAVTQSAPPPTPAPMPQPAQPTPPMPAPAAPAPPPVRTAPTPPPVQPQAGGIPQGGGGDGDADNSGGPSDGDGNI